MNIYILLHIFTPFCFISEYISLLCSLKFDGTEIFLSRFDVVAYLTEVSHLSCSYSSEDRIVTNCYLKVCITERYLSIKNYSLPEGADEIYEAI